MKSLAGLLLCGVLWAQAPMPFGIGGGGGGTGSVTVVSSGNLASTALVTGGGLQTLQTPCSGCTLTSAGVLTLNGSSSGAWTPSGITSGSATLGVADVAGSPNRTNLPIATCSAGAPWVSDGGNPQQITCTGLTEAGQTLADVTTLNVSTTKHGYVPKAPNDATKFLDGTGVFSVPSGGTSTFVDHQGAASAIAGNSTDRTIFTTTLPAITAGHCIFLTWALNNGGATPGSTTYKIFLDATSFSFNTSTPPNGWFHSWGEWSICNKAGVQNAQESDIAGFIFNGNLATPTPSTGSPAPGDTTLTADLSSSGKVLKLTFNANATTTVTPLMWNVRTN